MRKKPIEIKFDRQSSHYALILYTLYKQCINHVDDIAIIKSDCRKFISGQ